MSTTTPQRFLMVRAGTVASLLILAPGCPSDGGDAEASDTEISATTSSSSADSSSSTEASSTSTPSTSTTDSTSTTTGSTTTSTSAPSTASETSTEGSSSSESASAESTETEDEGSTGCGDTTSDPLNCGECGNVCAGADNGEATCEGSMCAIECDGGFDPVDVGGQTRCTEFAGFFLLRENQNCEAPNPFTGDCSCPSGFDDRPVTSWRVAPGDGASFVQLAACSPIAGTPTTSWGGLFAEYEATGSCAFPNPFNIPLCGCAAGYSVSHEWLGSNINGDAIRISFCTGEPFESEATFTGGFTDACNGGCAAGDSCMCPAGSTQVDYPTVVAGCSTTSSFCYPE